MIQLLKLLYVICYLSCQMIFTKVIDFKCPFQISINRLNKDCGDGYTKTNCFEKDAGKYKVTFHTTDIRPDGSQIISKKTAINQEDFRKQPYLEIHNFLTCKEK